MTEQQGVDPTDEPQSFLSYLEQSLTADEEDWERIDEPTSEDLDQLVDMVLACGAPISQIVGYLLTRGAMSNSYAGFTSAPEEARSLIRAGVEQIAPMYSARDVSMATFMLRELREELEELLPALDPKVFKRSKRRR